MGWKDAPEVTAAAWQAAPESAVAAPVQQTPQAEPGFMEQLSSAARRATVNQFQGMSLNTAHQWAPEIMAGVDEAAALTGFRPGNDWDSRVKEYRDNWNKDVDPVLAGAGSAPLAMFGGGMNTLAGMLSTGGLSTMGSLDQRGKNLLNLDDASLREVGLSLALAGFPTALKGTMGGLSWLGEKTGANKVGNQIGQYAGDAFAGAGDKIKNLAGWFKANSVHPTPDLGKKWGDLPGGIPGVGREMLDKGVGGLTKGITARQTEEAFHAAGSAIDNLATSYDAAGGAPINVNAALAQGFKAAQDLTKQATTRAAGERVSAMVREYQKSFAGREITAAEALEVKRALGAAVYGAEQELKKSGKTLMGDFGKGLAKFERAMDDQLDTAIGPEFEQANLSYRRLMGAKQATETQEARSAANLMLLGLGNMSGAGIGMMNGGIVGGATGLLSTALLSKYGSQVGARGLNGLGNAIQATPRFFGALASQPSSVAMSRASSGTLADLLRPQPYADALAMEDR